VKQRILSAATALALTVAWFGAPARAADDSGDVVVDVADASTGAPLSLVRVLVRGESGTIGYTDADGHARFESVATGTYRASVTKRNYATARSPLFDVIAHRTTTVRVRLAKADALKKIGGVSVSTSPLRASREVGQDDPLRYLDGSLRDALGDLPGLTSSGDGIAIDGNDPSLTGTTLDGVPIPGAGGAFGSRGLNSDLFAGASASSGPSHGSLGGNVGFRSLQPTRFTQALATLQYGSQNDSSALFAVRGSLRNLGYVAEHAVRGTTNPLTGLTYLDESGLSYRHDGDRTVSGDLVKLRWAPSLAQTLTATATATDEEDGLACRQRTALFPCGNGPGGFAHQRGALATLAESATIGATSLFVAGFASSSRYDDDRTRAAFAGVAAPGADAARSRMRGVTLTLQLPAADKHEIAFGATAYALAFDGTTTNAFGTTPYSVRSTYRAANVTDRYRPNQRLTLTGRAGVNGGTGNSSVAGGLDVRWQPVRDLAYDVAGTAGDSGSSIVINGNAFPDPASLSFDCANGLAIGSLPAQNAARQRSSALRASVERSSRRGRVALTAWTQHLEGAPVLAAFDGAALGLPPGYAASVAGLSSSPYVCGSAAAPSLAFTSYVPADQQVRGVTLAGTLQMGKALLAGYATVQSRFVTAATPATASLTPVGAQVPDAPLHRAGVVASVKLGRAVDALANVSYTAANNPSRLPAYTLVNAGVALPLQYGSLAIVGTNLTNAYAGTFAEARALPRTAGAPLTLPATPLRARGVQLTYTVRAGRLGAAGSGATAADASADEPGPGQGHRLAIRASGFEDTPPADALTIDPDNDECTPVAARTAQSVLDAIGALRAAAERAKRDGRYPATLPGTTVAGVPIRYAAYDDGTRFAVITTAAIPSGIPLMNCARLHGGPQAEFEKRRLLQPPAEKNAFLVVYAPSVGLYLVAPSDMRGGVVERADVGGEPDAPPAQPFALRADCPAQAKPVADAVVAAVRAALAARAAGGPVPPSDVAEIVAHAGPPPWLAITPAEPQATAKVLQCLRVAGVGRERLRALGIADDRKIDALGFTERLGFYSVSPGRPPRPAPAPSPSP
jgi:Carboxypeptidase regulatory-like domain